MDVRFYRLDWARRFIQDWQTFPMSDRPAFAEFSTRTGVEFAGTTAMVVHQLTMSEGS